MTGSDNDTSKERKKRVKSDHSLDRFGYCVSKNMSTNILIWRINGNNSSLKRYKKQNCVIIVLSPFITKFSVLFVIPVVGYNKCDTPNISPNIAKLDDK